MPEGDGKLVRVRLDGVESTIEHLKIIGEKDLGNQVRRDIRANLKPVLAAARAAAPVRSGLLRRRTAIIASLRRSGIRARTDKDESRDYAAPIHWGWPARNIEPNRFIWDTWKEREAQFGRDMDRSLRNWSRKAERKLNRNVAVTATRIAN